MQFNYGALPKLPSPPWSSFTGNTIPNKHFFTKPRFIRQESAASRDRRIFGGVEDDSESAKELCGPMLDVVLGLFSGVDYDDSLC